MLKTKSSQIDETLESDLDVLQAARHRASFADDADAKRHALVLWTLAESWSDYAMFEGRVTRGSAWCGHRYFEIKTGIVFAGEINAF
jgi:hypothetical protein